MTVTVCPIQKLPDLLVNKIAAGEVIERPASVVKELVENALDAGATRIQLTIEDGGRKLIQVADNGHGIPADQLRLAVTPHATSKIVREDDLYCIHTLGFRGEALASIGAVSHLILTSRSHDVLEGGQIHVAGEAIQAEQSVGCPVGTTVEVRDLFFNVPARRKFLKSSQTESGHIQEQLTRLALPKPEVEFVYRTPHKVILQLPAGETRLQRIGRFFGEETLSDLISIQREERGLGIDGYIAKPSQNRAGTQWQYLFLNGRYIRDRFIGHAVREAYRGLMEPSRSPIVFLFLTIDPSSVDVNVHPTKIEVRWQDSNVIYSQVLSALRDALLQHDLTPSLSTHRSAPALSPEQQTEERRRIAEFFKQASPPPIGPSSFSGEGPSAVRPSSVRFSDLAQMFHAEERSVTPAPSSAPSVDQARAIQLHRTYLVTETQDGLVIIDQHALHERILYEQLRRKMTTGSLESQRLLLPETVTLPLRQLSAVEAHQDLLQKLGIEITRYGPETIAVQSFPALLPSSIVTDFMRDLADRLIEKESAVHSEALLEEVLAMAACKAAVKAGDPLSAEEIQSLLQQREFVEKSSNCPHGRPTALRFTLSDLERQFKRT